MEIINEQALSSCIRDALRAELQEHLKTGSHPQQATDERLLSKQELANDLGVSLVTLSEWMKKGLPYLRLHKRVYFKKSEVLGIMQQNTTRNLKEDEQ